MPSEPPPGCVPAGEPLPDDSPPPSEPPVDSQPPPPDDGLQLFSLSAALKGSEMRIKLRSGKPTAVLSAPGKKLDKKRDGGLRVVTAPGATCSAYAQQGAKRVDLGRASDGKRDGLVVVTKKLLPKLGPGSWNLIATCSYRLGSTAGTATARGVTRVG
jgi:hypothetical protein